MVSYKALNTNVDTGRSLMSQGVPGCPTVPSLIGTGQWDSGTTIEKLKNKDKP